MRKFCSRSHGQPLPGVRSAAMISMSREMSREGFTGAASGLGLGGKQQDRSKADLLLATIDPGFA